jgi:hypothetical protein
MVRPLMIRDDNQIKGVYVLNGRVETITFGLLIANFNKLPAAMLSVVKDAVESGCTF